MRYLQAIKKTNVFIISSIVFFSLVIIFVLYPNSTEKGEKLNNPSLKDIEFLDYVSTGLRVATSPPENISQIVHKSWKKLGTTAIGNKTYTSLGQEIRLSVYTFDENAIPDKDYVFRMQNIGSIQNESYFIGETEVLHLNIPAKNSPPMEMNMFQKGKYIYVLRYTPDNLETANMILNLAIEGVEIW